MKFKSLKKVHAGKFIDRYDIVYETADGNDKVYEMISRDHDIDKAEDPFARLTRPHNDSVILVVTDETGEAATGSTTLSPDSSTPVNRPRKARSGNSGRRPASNSTRSTTRSTSPSPPSGSRTRRTSASSARPAASSGRARPPRRRSSPAGTRRKRSGNSCAPSTSQPAPRHIVIYGAKNKT